MTRKDILETAEKMVCGQREQDYGMPENNFQVIADLWNVYLKYSYNSTPLPDFTPFDVSMMMTLFKIGRIASGTCTDDSIVDACGYLACAGEIKASSDNNAAGTDEDEFSEEELLAVMKKYGDYYTPNDDLPYICCSDCPVQSVRGCTIQASCDGYYDAARHILKMTKETKNAGKTSAGGGTDEDEFSEKELLAVMDKYGTRYSAEQTLPYIYCADCPVGSGRHCTLAKSCDGHYDAAREILKMTKENKK